MRFQALAAVVVLAAASVFAVARAEPAMETSPALYPEGPLWHDGALLATEMGADRIDRFAGGVRTTYFAEEGCGPTSIAPYDAGLLILCHEGKYLVRLDERARATRRWKKDSKGVPLQDPNDSFADDQGGVYISDPGIFSAWADTTGAIVYLSKRGVLTRVAENLRYPNGVYFDAREQALYVDEHLNRRVLRYPVLGPGKLGPSIVFADIDTVAGKVGNYREAGPDGLERGPDGDLYVCLYGEGRILDLKPDGSLKRVLPVDTPYVTNIAFAPDGEAYVTGSYQNIAPNLDGRIFRLPR